MREIAAQVAVIGGGPAGLAAALAARQEGARKVILIERDEELGGILQQCIHSGFGLKVLGEELTGPEYAEVFIDQVAASDIEVLLDTMVMSIDPQRVITVMNPAQGTLRIRAESIVLAMGCRERTRGQIIIPGTRPAGIFTAGTAQRLVNLEGFLPGKKAVILGSGDVGLIMARRLTLEGMEVSMVLEAMPYPGGLERNLRQCLYDFGIPLHLQHSVIEVMGRSRVEGVKYAQVDEKLRPIPGTEREVECDTLILSVGLIPENEIAREAGVELDPATGGAVVDQDLQTSIPGVFACGNVLQVHDLVDNVTLEAQRAGRSAARYALVGEKAGRKPSLSVRAGQGMRYVLPQRLSLEEGSVTFCGRPDKPYASGRIVLEDGDRILWSTKVKKCKPS
ncbi:MAG: NAD(P)/FAD-dependent oxidoreductase, partial [Moorellaceae bacterium]